MAVAVPVKPFAIADEPVSRPEKVEVLADEAAFVVEVVVLLAPWLRVEPVGEGGERQGIAHHSLPAMNEPNTNRASAPTARPTKKNTMFPYAGSYVLGGGAKKRREPCGCFQPGRVGEPLKAARGAA
jgi:hypothetical protein